MDYNSLVTQVSKELNLPFRVVDKVYRSYWRSIRDTIQELPLKDNISEEEFAAIRHNGYAMTQDESEPGLFALSVPIFNFEGQVIASLTIAGPSMRFYDSIRQKMLFTMSQYAYEISHSLGYRKKA